MAPRQFTERELADCVRWPILCGHVGRKRHALLPDIDRRVICTLVRDPVSRTRSVYTFFRHNVRRSHPAYHRPELVAARELDFSSFIRHEVAQRRISNPQTAMLSGGGKLPRQASRQAALDLLEPFSVVGLTNQIAVFLDDLLRVMDVRIPMTAAALVDHTYQRRSKQSVDVSEADARHIRAINGWDLQLYDAAITRSAEGPRVDSACD
jgi:hypothetical protein